MRERSIWPVVSILLIIFNLLFFAYRQLPRPSSGESMSQHQDFNDADIMVLQKRPESVMAPSNPDLSECIVINLPPLSDIAQAQAQLQKFSPESVQVKVKKLKQSYWVYVSAANSLQALPMIVGKHIDHIRMRTGEDAGAVSLGLFDRKNAAQNLLEKLKSQGISTVRMREIERSLKPSVLVVRFVKSSPNLNFSLLKKIFPEAKLSDSSCS